MANINITPEVRSVLERSEITATSLKLPNEMLERKLYEAVNKVLVNAGGKWNRSAKAHLFPSDPRPKLGLALETGVAVDEKKKFQFFPTPKALANRMADHLGTCDDLSVLEPSAGHGALAEAVLRNCCPRILTMIEVNPECKEKLEDVRKRAETVGILASWNIDDFLKTKPVIPDDMHDRIIMNPPFTRGQDDKHVAHAIDYWLAPGGKLVAIMTPHTNEELDALLSPFHPCTWITEEIEAGVFKESGTNIRTMMLILHKLHRSQTAQ